MTDSAYIFTLLILIHIKVRFGSVQLSIWEPAWRMSNCKHYFTSYLKNDHPMSKQYCTPSTTYLEVWIEWDRTDGGSPDEVASLRGEGKLAAARVALHRRHDRLRTPGFLCTKQNTVPTRKILPMNSSQTISSSRYFGLNMSTNQSRGFHYTCNAESVGSSYMVWYSVLRLVGTSVFRIMGISRAIGSCRSGNHTNWRLPCVRCSYLLSYLYF